MSTQLLPAQTAVARAYASSQLLMLLEPPPAPQELQLQQLLLLSAALVNQQLLLLSAALVNQQVLQQHLLQQLGQGDWLVSSAPTHNERA
jgi:hypothetical protein